MPELHAQVIVNPQAGSRSVGRQWPQINRQLQKAGLSFEYELTRGSGHALDIASQAIRDGYNYLIAVGGDGTVNEVANGILRSVNPLSIILGIVSAGTAHAFTFSLGVTGDYRNSDDYSYLTRQRSVLIDIGVVKCWNRGQSIERFFVNEASVGLAAEIVDAWQSLPNRFGKGVNFALRNVAGYKALAAHQNKRVRLQIGDEVETISICTLVLSNGRYCADRMLIAPHASLDDGLLNVIVVGDVSRFEVLKIRPRLYDGSHVKHSSIREIKTSIVTIESDERILVEADWENALRHSMWYHLP